MNVKKESVVKDIALTIVTFGFWNLWVQLRQMSDVNDLLGEERFSHSLFIFVLLIILTLGLYLVYHEFIMTRELHKLSFKRSYLLSEILVGFLTFLGLWFVVDAYQQMLLNRYLIKNR